MTKKEIINFESEKQKILKSLEIKIKSTELDPTKLFLIEGFLIPELSMTIPVNRIFGLRHTLPIVSVMETDSGKLHFFALKSLLPDLMLWREEE